MKRKNMPKEQKTSFAELTFVQKISYIFGYYKYYMLAVVILAVVIGGTVWYHYRNYYNSVCNIFAVDGVITGYDSMSDDITLGFENYLGVDGKRTRVEIDYTNSLIDMLLDEEATVTRTKMVTKASVGDVDGYMASIDYIRYFSTDSEPFLYDLTELLSKDELSAIGDENIVYYTKKDGTQIPVAVNLSDTFIKKDTNLTMQNPCYGVVVTATNVDNAVSFIRYAFGL